MKALTWHDISMATPARKAYPAFIDWTGCTVHEVLPWRPVRLVSGERRWLGQVDRVMTTVGWAYRDHIRSFDDWADDQI